MDALIDGSDGNHIKQAHTLVCHDTPLQLKMG